METTGGFARSPASADHRERPAWADGRRCRSGLRRCGTDRARGLAKFPHLRLRHQRAGVIATGLIIGPLRTFRETNTNVILRSARRARLEGWQHPRLLPSFETLALRARSSG